MRRPRARAALMLVALSVAILSAGFTIPPLSDLAGHWSQSVVSLLARRGLVQGHPDGTFRPAEPLTRAQLARLLAEMLGEQVHAAELSRFPSSFRDLADHWAAGFAEALAEIELMRGYPDGSFQPERTVNRVEMVVLVARAAGLEPARAATAAAPAADAATAAAPPAAVATVAPALPYRDARQIPAWALPEVVAAHQAGLLQDLVGESFFPLLPVTRGEASAFIARVLAWQGALHHLYGTVLEWDAPAGRGVVLTAAGERLSLALATNAALFRAGQPDADLQPLDQVWVVLNGSGEVLYADGRYADALGYAVEVQGRDLVMIRSGSPTVVRAPVAAMARVFVNGRPGSLGDVHGAQQAYAVFDVATGEVRLLDAVRYTDYGHFGAVDPDARTGQLLRRDGRPLTVQFAPDALFFDQGRPVDLLDVPLFEPVMVYVRDGTVTYLQTDR